MSHEVKYDRNHHAGATPEARVASRLRNSGDVKHADVSVQKGDGPTRLHHQIHHTRNTDYGEGHPGEGSIDGRKRGVV